MVPQLELLARLLVGTLLAAVIGYERHVHGRPAGLRTHLLVGLASTTFMLMSTQFVYFQHYTKDDLIAVDPSRRSSRPAQASLVPMPQVTPTLRQ